VRSLAIVALVGCSAPERDTAAVDAPPPVDAPGEQLLERRVHQVLVGENTIIWTHGDFPPCSLEFGCSTRGPSLTYWNRNSGMIANRAENGTGSIAIAGSEQAFFIVTGLDYDQMYLRRVEGIDGVAMSVPRALTIGPALDSTYVYWGESRGTTEGGYTLYRATRTGDGGDRSVVATTESYGPPAQLTYAAGFLWWLEPGTSRVTRVPVAGGAIEQPGYAHTIAAFDDVVYAGRARSNGDGTYTSEVGRLDAAGAFEVIAQQTTNGASPRFIVKANEELYWSNNDGNVYRTDVAGGPIETIDARDDAGYVFAVFPNEILVRFTRSGFNSIPR
jgi:hypothetical protein